MPPRSLLLQLALLSCLVLLPPGLARLGGLIGPGPAGGAAWIAAGLLACGLLADLLVTRRRYRRWALESLCADCRRSFRMVPSACGATPLL